MLTSLNNMHLYCCGAERRLMSNFSFDRVSEATTIRWICQGNNSACCCCCASIPTLHAHLLVPCLLSDKPYVQENLLLIMAARLAFIAEWLDPNSGVLWRYQLFYYPATGEIEMVITGSTHQVACWLYER